MNKLLKRAFIKPYTKFILKNPISSKFAVRNFCDKSKVEITKSGGLISKVKKYGKFGIAFYWIYCVLGFAGFYLLLTTKIIKLEKVIESSEKWGVDKYVNIRKKTKEYPNASNIVAAYLLNQLFEVVRLPTTIMFLSYYFRKYKR